MSVINKKILYAQDSFIVQEETIKAFNLSRTDTSIRKKLKAEVFNFVGFSLNKEQMLVVFPKNYFETSELEIINSNSKILEDDIQLLFSTIYKYIITEKSKALANRYIGNDPEFDSDYPFIAFFNIYNYYKRYGVFQENYITTQIGYSGGKVSWKDTIRKSSLIISDGNILFSPLYTKKKKSKQVFISECMIFAIQYTIKNFSYFLSLKPIKNVHFNINFAENKEYILKQLYKAKNEVFKDIHKKLIDDLIKFYQDFDKDLRGGSIHIKINYFNIIWQKMIEKYLNDNFVKVDESKHSLIFNQTQKCSQINFKSQTFKIDQSSNEFTITPDHYAKIGDIQYIFDSKYYTENNLLNYKQLAYNELLIDRTCKNQKIFNALILPGKTNSKIHFQLSNKLLNKIGNNIIIIEQHLPVKEIMKNYIDA